MFTTTRVLHYYPITVWTRSIKLNGNILYHQRYINITVSRYSAVMQSHADSAILLYQVLH